MICAQYQVQMRLCDQFLWAMSECLSTFEFIFLCGYSYRNWSTTSRCVVDTPCSLKFVCSRRMVCLVGEGVEKVLIHCSLTRLLFSVCHYCFNIHLRSLSVKLPAMVKFPIQQKELNEMIKSTCCPETRFYLKITDLHQMVISRLAVLILSDHQNFPFSKFDIIFPSS